MECRVSMATQVGIGLHQASAEELEDARPIFISTLKMKAFAVFQLLAFMVY